MRERSGIEPEHGNSCQEEQGMGEGEGEGEVGGRWRESGVMFRHGAWGVGKKPNQALRTHIGLRVVFTILGTLQLRWRENYYYSVGMSVLPTPRTPLGIF